MKAAPVLRYMQMLLFLCPVLWQKDSFRNKICCKIVAPFFGALPVLGYGIGTVALLGEKVLLPEFLYSLLKWYAAHPVVKVQVHVQQLFYIIYYALVNVHNTGIGKYVAVALVLAHGNRQLHLVCVVLQGNLLLVFVIGPLQVAHQ